MKQVFQNHSQVCHAFNLQNQERGRAGNIFFEGKNIYSYGYHYLLGVFIDDDTILINNKGYSSSTSKHIGILTDATRNRKQIFLKDIELNEVLIALEGLFNDLMKARKPETYYTRLRRIYRRYEVTLNDLGGFYLDEGSYKEFKFIKLYQANDEQDLKLDRIDEIMIKANEYSESETYLKKVERAKELDEKRKEEKAERIRKYYEELERTKAERIERFYNYEANRISNLSKDLLRLSKCGQYIETSQAVQIPINEAKRYFALFKRGNDLKGERIGQFTTLSNRDNVLQIGCHYIEHEEINRMGNLINA